MHRMHAQDAQDILQNMTLGNQRTIYTIASVFWKNTKRNINSKEYKVERIHTPGSGKEPQVPWPRIILI
jgi:hypothetical protein